MTRAMAEENVTFRALEQRTRDAGVRGGRGLTAGYLNSVRKGNENPSLETIEAVCAALGLDAFTIEDYLLARIRQMFDQRPAPDGVGRDQALANLERYGFVSTETQTEAAQEALRLVESAARQREGTERRTGADRRRRGAEG